MLFTDKQVNVCRQRHNLTSLVEVIKMTSPSGIMDKIHKQKLKRSISKVNFDHLYCAPFCSFKSLHLPGFSLCPLICDAHSLSLSRGYEEHILATGSLDERIFTGEGANEDIGTPGPCLCEGVENQDSATNRLHASLTVRQRARVSIFALSQFLLLLL